MARQSCYGVALLILVATGDAAGTSTKSPPYAAAEQRISNNVFFLRTMFAIPKRTRAAAACSERAGAAVTSDVTAAAL